MGGEPLALTQLSTILNTFDSPNEGVYALDFLYTVKDSHGGEIQYPRKYFTTSIQNEKRRRAKRKRSAKRTAN
jgi:hypothetical protein